jgi:hypothetical protein
LGASFTINPIVAINVQIPGTTVIDQYYVVTQSPSSCAWQPTSFLPSVDYLSYDSNKFSIDTSKIPLSDEGLKVFTLTVDSPTASDTTAG